MVIAYNLSIILDQFADKFREPRTALSADRPVRVDPMFSLFFFVLVRFGRRFCRFLCSWPGSRFHILIRADCVATKYIFVYGGIFLIVLFCMELSSRSINGFKGSKPINLVLF